jgi:hypothetical protein
MTEVVAVVDDNMKASIYKRSNEVKNQWVVELNSSVTSGVSVLLGKGILYLYFDLKRFGDDVEYITISCENKKGVLLGELHAIDSMLQEGEASRNLKCGISIRTGVKSLKEFSDIFWIYVKELV